jgi:hypothetical protein
LALCIQTAALIVGEAKSPVAQLLPQGSVLLAEVVDCELLVFVHPAGHCDQQKPERVENSGRRQSALSQSNEQLPVLDGTGYPVMSRECSKSMKIKVNCWRRGADSNR